MDSKTLPPAPAWVPLAAAVIRHLPMGRYRAMHRLCRKPPPAFLMQMPEDIGGYSFHCDLRDAISREVCFAGHYEPQETALVQSILQSGMSFVDVGANWGYFTLLAASLVGPTGRVLSLEPDPRLFPILQENVRRGELNQVTVLQVAAAHEPGTLMLAGYAEDGGNFGVSRIVANSGEEHQVFQVRSDSLDRILHPQGFSSVDLLKMDIEGAEAFAIAGLENSLAEKKIKRLVLELHPAQLAEHGSSITAIVQILQNAGYRAWTIDHSPVANRRAGYNKRVKIKSLLSPLDTSQQYDAWPHQLWLAPGVE
jgi:FkbM family methyltransferase